MPDSPASRELLDRASGDWSIFDEVAALPEPERRKLLRFHREAGVSDEEEIDRRNRLDAGLNRIELRELGLEVGVLDGDGGLAEIPQLRSLLASDAFVRYADNYLSLSIRFVAERLGVETPSQPRLNELPVGRPWPPAITPRWDGESEQAVEDLLDLENRLEQSNDVRSSEAFLDELLLPEARERHAGGALPADLQKLFELWLRGLASETEYAQQFQQIARGLAQFVREKTLFYIRMERLQFEKDEGMTFENWMAAGASRKAFLACNPLTARFGLFDLYWFAKILRAEISPTGAVIYRDGSWLRLLKDRPRDTEDRSQDFELGATDEELEAYEDMIRSVLDYACDLIQNAAEIVTARLEQGGSDQPIQVPPTTWGWRRVFDEELEEIALQRQERRGGRLQMTADLTQIDYPSSAAAITRGGDAGGDGTPDVPKDTEWSRRIRTGEHVRELVGLAVSGGGIRSATFGLGILERLQELDLLRRVDYLSTVSGGGYIGSWLIGNVHRNRYWLTQPTDWEPSIAHLRRYSNYLAPRTGLLSADTWTMWGSWIRNTVLIQLTAVAWLAFAMIVVGIGGLIFEWKPPSATPGAVLGGLMMFTKPAIGGHRAVWLTYPWIMCALVSSGLVVLTYLLLHDLRRDDGSRTETGVQLQIVMPALTGAFISAAALWATRFDWNVTFGHVVTHALLRWWIPLLIFFGSFYWLALRSAEGAPRYRSLSFLAALSATVTTYLVACGVLWIFSLWGAQPEKFVWFAFAFGPSLMLIAPTSGVTVMIGILGLDSKDWRREWWTRFGSWLAIYAAGFLAIGTATVFGPWILLKGIPKGLEATPLATWTAVLGWIGTVIGGLLAGNSERSDGEHANTTTAMALGWFARFAALSFIIGALFAVATLVHIVLANLSDVQNILKDNYWTNLKQLNGSAYLAAGAVLALVGLVTSWRFDLNVFGLNQFYRNRLVRCYLGATRWQPHKRRPHIFTGFDPEDDLPLSNLRHGATDDPRYRGPFPILNGALNLGGSADLSLNTRHSASFVMTPLRCGADRPRVGFAPTSQSNADGFAGGVTLGQSVSISGAAASPNMGYDTSPLVSFLLTMFNVRLAWWFPNPGSDIWTGQRLRKGFFYLIKETFGMADETSAFVNVSDGGHFENLGIYELIRRRCKVIIASDGECDDQLTFGSLGRVIRTCRTDFGADIDIDVESIRRDKQRHLSRAHCAIGTITYKNGSRGYLIYLKASMSGDEEVDVQQYHASHPAFPHESTGDQFFSEDQFESYRTLGYHIATTAFQGIKDSRNMTAMADKLKNLWVAEKSTSSDFVDRAQALTEVWDRMRANAGLTELFRELHGLRPSAQPLLRSDDQELVICLELIQLMENAFLELRLDEHWEHPDNSGWVELFTMWARSARFRYAWRRYQDVFGIRFGYFCKDRLGM